MFGKAAERLTNRLIKNNIIKQEDFDIYQFGIENFIMKACHIVSYLILGICFKLVPELLIFLAAFIPLRENSGGYHAKTPLKCYIVSCGTVITYLCLMRFLPNDIMEYSSILALASSLVLFIIIPVESENKPLDETEMAYYKSKAGFLIIIELALVLIFRLLLWSELSFIIALSLFYELFVALAGIYTKIYDSDLRHVE